MSPADLHILPPSRDFWLAARCYHLDAYLTYVARSGLVPRATTLRLDGTDGSDYCALVGRINDDRLTARWAADVREDIQAHPEFHQHTAEGLKACCLVAADVDGEHSSDGQAYVGLAIDLSLIDAHEKIAPPLKLRDVNSARSVWDVGPGDYVLVGGAWLEIASNTAFGAKMTPPSWLVTTKSGHELSMWDIDRYAKGDDLIRLRFHRGLHGGEIRE